jgi:hypothetical protein
MSRNLRRFDPKSFQEWKNNPLNRVFLAYLKDQQSDLMKQWASGQEMDLRHQTKALLLGELADLSWSDYAAHYEIETNETESAPE